MWIDEWIVSHLQAWLNSKGWDVLGFIPDINTILPQSYGIGFWTTTRAERPLETHAVIMHHDEIVHDPLPKDQRCKLYRPLGHIFLFRLETEATT